MRASPVPRIAGYPAVLAGAAAAESSERLRNDLGGIVLGSCHPSILHVT